MFHGVLIKRNPYLNVIKCILSMLYEILRFASEIFPFVVVVLLLVLTIPQALRTANPQVSGPFPPSLPEVSLSLWGLETLTLHTQLSQEPSNHLVR